MNGIFKRRFWTWFMWLLPIACTGFFSIYVWTVLQMFVYYHEVDKEYKPKPKLRERKGVVEMNKTENLTEKEQRFLASDPTLVKIQEGVYVYDRK